MLIYPYNEYMQTSDPFLKQRLSMVESQIERRGIDDERILAAFREIPRHLFVPSDQQMHAYGDHPLAIGHSQTISQPYIVALMTSCLVLEGDEKVLEIGTGSGYQTAVLANLTHSVYSVELIPELSHQARKNINALGINNIDLRVGDGSLGWPDHQPYDRIIITASAPAIPQEIKQQLKDGGLIAAPVGKRWRQNLEVWKRDGDEFNKKTILPVAFVPLRGKYGWQD